MNDRQRIESLFEAALEVDPARRSDFVAAACGDNETMRNAVMRLLAGHSRRGVLDADAAELFSSQAPPERIGPYRLLREIGRGGMGTVYDAERDDGQFRRRVAIKIIRTFDPELQQRIIAERQILAALDHPNIARLLDGGMTPEGLPFIVMEHVDGMPVDVYCDRMRLTVRERLQLMVLVARAVEFAHRNLIVHCDLKPSNILVTPDGRVKLLDFGVARLLNPVLTPGITAPASTGLTLHYASPEQLRGEAVTTATDVFALGVLLYEVLTGCRPWQGDDASHASYVAAVFGESLLQPSARILRDLNRAPLDAEAGAISAAAVARDRQTSAARLIRELRGDVDAIVACALRIDPRGRYGSAELLAQDLERHLFHRPVRARRNTRRYVFGRLVQRHRLQAAAVALALGGVLSGAAAAAWQARAATYERQRAEEALRRASTVADFLLELFNAGEQGVQGTITGRDLIRRGAARVDQLAEQPDVQARLLSALGTIHESMGEYAEGHRVTERALRLLSQRGVIETAEGAALLVQLGILTRRLGEYDSAQALFNRARDIQQRVLEPTDPAIARTLHNLASIAIYLGDFTEAERRAREAVDLMSARLGESHRMTVNLLTQLGTIQRARGNRDAAEQTLRRAIQLRARSSGSTRHEVLNDRFQLAATINADPTRAAEAAALFRAELPLLRDDVADDVFFIAWAEGSLADQLERDGGYAASEPLRRHIYEMRLGAFGPDHPATAEATVHLGRALLRTDPNGEAEKLIRDGVAAYRRIYGARHAAYAGALLEQATALEHLGRLEAADSVVAIAAAIRLDRYGAQSHGYIDALRYRASLHAALQKYDLAESFLRQALEQTQQVAGDGRTGRLGAIHREFASLYRAWGRPADAQRHEALAAQPD